MRRFSRLPLSRFQQRRRGLRFAKPSSSSSRLNEYSTLQAQPCYATFVPHLWTRSFFEYRGTPAACASVTRSGLPSRLAYASRLRATQPSCAANAMAHSHQQSLHLDASADRHASKVVTASRSICDSYIFHPTQVFYKSSSVFQQVVPRTENIVKVSSYKNTLWKVYDCLL